MEVTMQVKHLFFNRAEVIREVGRLNAAALRRAGAFVRRRARSSMRRRKAASNPGSPPSAHSRHPTRSLKNILFAYDPVNKSVVIGPVLFSRSQPGGVPAIHEFGGAGRGTRRSKKPARTVRFPARPFMGPALAAEAPNFPSLWVSSAGGRVA